MTSDSMAAAIRVIDGLSASCPLGRVVAASGGLIEVAGLAGVARLGDRARIGASKATSLRAEVIRVGPDRVHMLPEGSAEGIALSAPVRLFPAPVVAPDDSWIGRVIDPDGCPLDGRGLLPGPVVRSVLNVPPPAHARRGLGPRVETGLAAFNTLLPIARGQRIGLFAGSGVGKSSLLGQLATGIAADVVVVGLVGERGRELRGFTDQVLGAEGLSRAVVVAATSDRSPQTRRRCAWTATAVAEHFRDQGLHVLLVIDSVTRFAEAHREVAVAAGEGAALRGFPASTGPTIAALCERAGPGTRGTGDITAVYSVLVAGSDMEEPVADWLRGVLDGHVVLSRDIAERGRFPAVDLLRSVSRSLPAVASPAENQLIDAARRSLGTYARSEMMIQAGLYQPGSDPAIDLSIAAQAELDQFMARVREPSIEASFAALRKVLTAAASKGRER